MCSRGIVNVVNNTPVSRDTTFHEGLVDLSSQINTRSVPLQISLFIPHLCTFLKGDLRTPLVFVIGLSHPNAWPCSGDPPFLCWLNANFSVCILHVLRIGGGFCCHPSVWSASRIFNRTFNLGGIGCSKAHRSFHPELVGSTTIVDVRCLIWHKWTIT